MKPDLLLHRVTDIDIDCIEKLGIKALLLDVDNTLSTHHGMELVSGLEEWISNMKNHNIPLVILSNSKEKRVSPFAQKIGLDYISLGLKPLPFGYIRGAKKLNLKIKEVALVGDQLFTDVLGAKTVGMKVILLDPIKLEDKWHFKLRRKLENILLRNLREKRLKK